MLGQWKLENGGRGKYLVASLWGSVHDIVNSYEWFNMKSDMTVFACKQCLSE